MQDRIPLYPGRVTMTPVAGQANTFAMVRADDPTQAGTPLNKATLLKDATAALYGLGTGAVPDDVLAELGKYKQYWWKRKEYTPGTYTLDASATIPLPYNSGIWFIQYSDTVSVDAFGVVSLPNYTELTGLYSGQAKDALDTVKGKFFRYGGGGSGINVNTAQIYLRGSADAYWSSGLKAQGQKVIGVAGSYVATDYVLSSDRGTYPDSGIVGNYEYEYLGIPFDNAVTAPKIETGSYVGTGTFGASKPNTLTFGFAPKFVIFIDNGFYNGSKTLYESLFQRARNLINCELLPDSYGDSAYFLGPSGYSGRQYTDWKEAAWKTNGGKTINWLSTNSAAYQFNESNHTYYYLAIG